MAVRILCTLLRREIFPLELYLCQVWPLTAELLDVLALVIVVRNAVVSPYCFLI